ncbi:hypothetical protein [Serratia marcescens]|uniref:hypothetical protein n=1 Tax=Serratia marcescens TaxID=615 RepID=UPI000D73BE63|nr:hypothetical protein [Serratia marcescens]AWQ49217.1 hypothetical protein B1A42_18485 [Serratia marcescens]
MTLTTERQQFEEWAKGEGFSLARGIPVDCGNCIYVDGDTYILWQAWQASRELLANRVAQPVMWAHERKLSTDVAITKDEVVAAAWKSEGLSITPLYTALHRSTPPAMVGELLEAMEEVIRISDRDHDAWNRVKVAITAYRAAMLAQPVSSGYTLNSPVIPDGWKLVPVEPTEDMLRAAYRESGVYSAKTYRAMLAAAPESVNG